MKEIQEWNPYYIGASCSLYRPEQFYPWLLPYGSSRRYISLWNDPEQMEDVEDKKRIMEMVSVDGKTTPALCGGML